MKGPLCEECVKSGVLCEECSQKLESKEISELDIEVARLLYKLEKRDLVRGASFERAHLVGNLIVITTKGRPSTVWARMRPVNVAFSLNSAKNRNMPAAVMIRGTISGEIMIAIIALL